MFDWGRKDIVRLGKTMGRPWQSFQSNYSGVVSLNPERCILKHIYDFDRRQFDIRPIREQPESRTYTAWHCPCQSMLTERQWNLMQGSGRKEEHTYNTLQCPCQTMLTGRQWNLLEGSGRTDEHALHDTVFVKVFYQGGHGI